MVYNGGEVISIPMSEEYALLPDRTKSAVLLNGKAKHFQHLFDRMIIVSPDLKELMLFVKTKVSSNWYKTIRGRVITLMLTRYMMFQMNPKWYANKMDLVLYANYSIIKNYLQRIVKVLIKNYGLEDRYYKLYIQPKKLYELSKLWANDMYETSLKMVTHYHKLHPNT